MSGYDDVVSWENEAVAAAAKGNDQEAIKAHGQALVIAGELDRPHLLAVLYNALGNALEAGNHIQQAVIAYEAGLKALAGGLQGDLARVIDTLRSVAKGYDPGLAHLEVPDLYSETTASDLAEAEGDPVLAVKLLINIGNAYLRQPEIDPALNAYKQALERREIAGAPALRAHALTHVGIIRRRRGELDQAEAALAEALDLLEEHGSPLEKRRVLSALAGIYRGRQQVDLAVETYRQALALYEQADDALGEARTRASLGHLYLEQRRFADALEAFQRAVELATEVDDEETLWHTYWGLGRCQREAGDLEGAAVSYRRSLNLIDSRQQELRTDEGKVAFLESMQDLFDQLIAVHLERAHAGSSGYEDALAMAENARGRALRDLMRGRERRHLSRGADVRSSRRRPFAERFPPWVQMAPGVFSSREAYPPMIQMAPGAPSPPPDFRPMAQMAPGFELAGPVQPEDSPVEAPSDREAVAEMPPLARLVFHILPDRTAVFAVTPEGQVHGEVIDLDRDALADRVGQLRKALQVDDQPRGVRLARDVRRVRREQQGTDPKPLLREMYGQLIAPLAQTLPTDGTPVVIEPDGPLWLLPFAALLGPDDTWLADQWPLLYAPSAQVLAEIRDEADHGDPSNLKALIVGNPEMPKVPAQGGLEIELRPLPGAETEARTIASRFPEERRSLLLGPDADRTTVVERMPDYGILHLSTHGIAYAEDPLGSFVALAAPGDGDGLLTARQVMDLSLPADLVALSACQTGLGRVSGDGMIGLSRAFLVAGARAVLVSQWSVSDDATAELMVAFYRYYVELDDKAIALQQAMRDVRSRPQYAQPRFWAPFVVVGAEA